MSPAQIDAMREHYRQAVPLLRQEDWDKADIDAIGPAIKRAQEGGEEAVLRCWADWLLWKAKDAYVAFPPNVVRGCDLVITTRAEQERAEGRR